MNRAYDVRYNVKFRGKMKKKNVFWKSILKDRLEQPM